MSSVPASTTVSAGSTPSTPPSAPQQPPPHPAIAPAKELEYNRLHLNFREPMPRPKVRGLVIDWHTHLVAARHGKKWFEAAAHFGIECFGTMAPLEEAIGLQRDWPGRLHFIAIPAWGTSAANWLDDYLRRLDGFYNLGSRVLKFHMAPGSMHARGIKFDSPQIRRLVQEAKDRRMIVMTHIGDPDTWYAGKYTDHAKYGTREEHYRMWENVMNDFPQVPWVGAHMGGNPEDLSRLQRLFDKFPRLMLDCSATRWMVREISQRREEAREFFIRNQDRLLFGSDQVSGDDRGFDFLASRFWCHRKLWETAYIGPSPIFDPDLPADQQPQMRGLALPDVVLQKMYHDNAIKLLASVGASFEGWG